MRKLTDKRRALTSKTKLSALAIVFLLSGGCSTGVIVHDQTRAAELVVDFLSSLGSDQGIRLAYDWTDDRYKKEVSFAEFSRIVSSIRGRNRGADIRLVGYEIFGAKEALVVYASSVVGKDRMFFKFSLFGSKTSDYYLLNLNVSNTGFSKKGIYREYGQSIIVEGV